MKTAVTALYAADPFLLSDAPAGSTKLVMSLGTPNRSVAAAMLTGSVALDDAVEKARKSASDVERMNSPIVRRAPKRKSGASVTTTWTTSATTTTAPNAIN